MGLGMGVFALVVLGGVAGWVASMIAGTNAKMGIPANIIVGVLGAFFGSWLFNMFGAHGAWGFSLYSFVVAVVGSSLLLFVFRRVFR